MLRKLILCAWLGAALAAADGSIVIKGGTGEILVDGGELPKAGVGIWRLDAGSTVSSKAGFVELAVGEGGWLRLRPETTLRLVSDDEHSIVIEVERGAAVLDMLHKPEVETIELHAAGASMSVDGKGSFLAEANPGRFAVLKGKAEAQVGGQALTLKSKTAIPADGSAPAEKLAKLEEDEFEEWREDRNDEIIREERRANTFAERTIRPAR